VENLSDKILVLKLQNGDLEALGVLFDRYRYMVYRTALAITGEPAAAEDMLQDVFLRLHRFANRVDPERPLEPWLYRVTANLTCTWVKRRKWYHQLEDFAEWLVGDNRNSPPIVAENADQERWIRMAISKLPLAHRTVIVMYYINDLSLNEISDVLEVPLGTVKSRLFYGRKTLKDLLLQHEGRLPEAAYEFT